MNQGEFDACRVRITKILIDRLGVMYDEEDGDAIRTYVIRVHWISATVKELMKEIEVWT